MQQRQLAYPSAAQYGAVAEAQGLNEHFVAFHQGNHLIRRIMALRTYVHGMADQS